MRTEPSSFRILVVDDDLLVLDVLDAMLTSVGHNVSVTDDPQKSLELIWKEDFDLVITDLGMPVLDGWAVARQVKAKNALTPVILVTGWGVQYENRDLRELGVDLLFSKPLDRQVLIAAVQELASHSIPRHGRRRRQKRFPGKHAQSVKVIPLSFDSPPFIGELLDISMSGLSFRHTERQNPTGTLLSIEIRSVEGLEFDLSPSRVVYDMMYQKEPASTGMEMGKRCGIQFEDISGERLCQLESFVRSLANGE